MIELTLYGRGGQGGVTLAKMIATAFFLRGRYSQAFGVYAAERSGAPIQAYVRIDDAEITNHNQIREPDHIIVLDPTLIGAGILAGMKPEGWMVLNTTRPAALYGDLFPGRRVAAVDATSIAIAHGLGTRSVPIVNTTLMGAVARVFGLRFEEVEATFAELGFGGANLEAAKEAFEKVTYLRLPGSAAPHPASGHPLPASRGEGLPATIPPTIRTGAWATRRPARRTLTPPCNHICPAGNDVQRFLEAASRGAYEEALSVLLETTPLPGICGRVCPAPCMASCNRNAFDEGVNVREIERYVADHAFPPNATSPWRGQRIAVVGSGPAGLSAAYHLGRLGYRVEIFEASDELGGVLRNGIPDYRLPKDVVDREIGFILDHGVVAHTNERVDAARLDLLSERFDAVFVATGLQKSNAIPLGGFVEQGIDFLDRVHRGDVQLRDRRVVVVGGGNTAVDAARSALRLGAASVRIVYRRTRKEMPAIAEEIDAAIEEGIALHELVLPIAIDGSELTCVRMKLGEPDASGRRRPIPDPATEFAIACDHVILAIGQSPDRSIAREEGAFLLGGDLKTNAGTVAAAIGSGRLAAWQIHRGFTGESLFDDDPPQVAMTKDLHLNLFDHAPRERGRTLPHALRARGFLEVHGGFGDGDAAAAEAKRCLSCGVCNSCDRCVQYCPEGILVKSGDAYTFNYDYCKGCGVCASECPRGVVIMSEL